MPIATRLTNTGNLLVNGLFDEVTSISPSKFRTTANTVYAGTFNEVSDMIVTNGLLLYVNGSPDVYSGTGTTWADLSTYNNNATLINSPTYNASTGGGSFAFNGSTQYAPVTTALLNTTYTGKTVFFVGRLNASAFTPGVAQFRAMFGSANIPRNFNFYVHQSAANVVDFHYSTSGSAFFTGAVSLGTNWFVAAVTQDATTTKVYLNGTEIYSVAGQTLNQYANGGEEAVAKADNYWYGDVAVCAVYSRALSAAEILNNYNAFSARVGLTPTATAPVERDSSDGTIYVTGNFDEFTGAPVVDGNLKAWLDAGQTASYPGTGSIWYDISGKNSHAVLFNSASFNSTSLSMSLTGGYIAIPIGNVTNVTTTSAVTASVWFNPTAVDTNYRRIISRDSFPTQNWYIEFNGGSVGNVFAYSGTASTGNTPIAANVWYNLTLTATASSVSLYKNGSLVSFNGAATSFLGNTAAIGIGSDGNGGSPFLGNISQVMIYDRALSADEVTTNFNAMRGRYGI